MNICVLDSATLGDDLEFELLEKYGRLTKYDYTSDAELHERIKDADVIIINKIKITNDVLENAKKLKLICVFATGYDNVDIISAARHGVAVTNVPSYSTESVMLFTVTTVLSLLTHINQYRKFVSSGEYTESGKPNAIKPVYHELKGKKWGIIGFGNIGRRVGEVAKALGADVIVNKRNAVEDYDCVDIDTLCAEADIITIHCPLTEQTRQLINRKRISLMKRDVILVNEARGAVVDEVAVTEAILDGRIGGFGTDVYSQEPFSTEHPYNKILDLKNVCMTPHAAWGAYESRVRCLNVICENIRAFSDGEIKNRVDILGQK